MSFVTLLFLGVLLPQVSSKHCVEGTISVPIIARNGVFGGQPRLRDNFDVTFFTQNFTTQGHNYSEEVLTGYTTIDASYNISARLCRPTSRVHSKQTVQVLTHGIGFDKLYWDSTLDPDIYSYVNVATDKYGYTTLAYDRLSVGNSSHPDPYNITQLNAEVAILDSLTTMLRSGKLFDVDTSSYSVVHIGHSFGSVISYTLASRFPQNTDGLILTGYSQPETADWLNLGTVAFNSKTARSLDPALWGSLDPGYMTWNDVYANIYDFFHPPTSTRAAQLYAEAHKQPHTVGELLSIGAVPQPATGFTGPALVLTGQRDTFFCGGDCLATGTSNASSIPALVGQNLPNASAFEAVILPETGHGLALHLNAQDGYKVMNEFLGKHGL